MVVVGDDIPDVFTVYNFNIIFTHGASWYTSPLLDQWRSITSNRLVLNTVNGHHLQFRTWPLLFHTFQWFNIKAVLAHHHVIQKEVYELLAMRKLNYQLMVLVSIPMCLWFLSIWVVYDLFSILSSLIATCTYLLLRCLLLNR